VYGIVRQHGGFILLDTAEGAGCRFRIYLPLMNESTAEEEAEAAPEKIRAPRRSDETVLVAEDEAAVRRLMAGIVRLQGYATLEAEDGEAALAAAEKLGRPLDLLIADVVMPKLGGVELAQRLRQKFPALRVLYVTGFTDRQNVAQMAQQQGDHYLEKPFARGRLLDAVEAALAAPPRRS